MSYSQRVISVTGDGFIQQLHDILYIDTSRAIFNNSFIKQLLSSFSDDVSNEVKTIQ